MTYVPVTIEGFGGLNTLVDPTEVAFNGAVDMSNVELDHPGTVRTRAGFASPFSSAAITAGAMCAYTSAGGSEYVAATSGTNTIPFNLLGGANGSTLAAVASTNNGMVRFGNATTRRLYLVDGTATMHRLETTTWTNVTLPSVARPVYAAIYPVDNRLAVAGGQRVWFSAVDDPETWSYTAGPPETGDFVDLDPGDGEIIMGMATWRDQLFVFKQSKFFVFYGTSVDNDGGAIFNYRAVRNAVGCDFGAAIGGNNGVYFVNSHGSYFTTGDVPVRVSDALDWELLQNNVVTVIYQTPRLYIQGLVSGNYAVHILDENTQRWEYWDLGATRLGMCPVPDQGFVTFIEPSASKLAFLGSGTNDDETDIDWSYTTGISNLGIPDRKVIRELSLWGEGTVTVQVSVDGGAFDTGSTLTLGTSSIAEGVQRIARRGTDFQLKFSGTGVASISRAVMRLRDQEAPK